MNETSNEHKICGIYSMKASITVEATLIMPLMIACIMLLVITNGYLHDTVVLNGISVETVYSDMEDKDTIFYEQTQQRSLWLRNVEFLEQEDLFNRTVKWQKTYSLPLKGILSMITEETRIDLSGSAQKRAWSMPQIIRYVKQN